MKNELTPQEIKCILSRELITATDIAKLFKMGRLKAKKAIFDKVWEAVEKEGKLNIPDRVSARRVYDMLGVPYPLK